jgi:hypothetical protein
MSRYFVKTDADVIYRQRFTHRARSRLECVSEFSSSAIISDHNTDVMFTSKESLCDYFHVDY